MVTIRKARLADLGLTLLMEREFDREQRATVVRRQPKLKPYLRRMPGANKIVQRRFRKYISSRNAEIYVAEDSQQVIGFATISIEKNDFFFPARFGMIGYLYVRKAHRGRRISSMLVNEITGWLTKRRIKDVGLGVLVNNVHARSIYKKWGYVDSFAWMWKL